MTELGQWASQLGRAPHLGNESPAAAAVGAITQGLLITDTDLASNTLQLHRLATPPPAAPPSSSTPYAFRRPVAQPPPVPPQEQQQHRWPRLRRLSVERCRFVAQDGSQESAQQAVARALAAAREQRRHWLRLQHHDAPRPTVTPAAAASSPPVDVAAGGGGDARLGLAPALQALCILEEVQRTLAPWASTYLLAVASGTFDDNKEGGGNGGTYAGGGGGSFSSSGGEQDWCTAAVWKSDVNVGTLSSVRGCVARRAQAPGRAAAWRSWRCGRARPRWPAPWRACRDWSG